MGLIDVIKQASIDAMEANNPVAIMFGVVTKVSPLEINVEQRFTLTEEFLVFTERVRQYEVDITHVHGQSQVAAYVSSLKQTLKSINALLKSYHSTHITKDAAERADYRTNLKTKIKNLLSMLVNTFLDTFKDKLGDVEGYRSNATSEINAFEPNGETSANAYKSEIDAAINSTYASIDAEIESGVNSDVGNTDEAIQKRVIVRYGLKVGDKVLLLRVQGGQKYVVLDKIVDTLDPIISHFA